MPRVSNVEHYARIVRQKSVLRSVAHRAERISELALSGNGNAAEALSDIRALCDLQGDAGTPAWKTVFHTFGEFEEAAPLQFAVRQFLQIGGATMIGGLAGHGKTFILLAIVKALLGGKGTKLWNTFEVEESAARVLYLIPESTLAPFKYRLRLFGLYDCLRPEDGRLWVRTLDKGPAPCLSDAKILAAAKGSHVVLDTAIRFATEGEENSASDNQRGLATDIFALLGAGARSVIAAHHAPKAFSEKSVMSLEAVLRGTGDIGATMCAAFGLKGWAAIDRRTSAARDLLEWKAQLVADQGGEQTIPAAKMELIDMASRSRALIAHIDVWLMAQPSIINKRKKSLHPIVQQRQQLCDSLSRILSQIGLTRLPKPVPSLQDYLRSRESALPVPQDEPSDTQSTHSQDDGEPPENDEGEPAEEAEERSE